jgi:hypothetical protein
MSHWKPPPSAGKADGPVLHSVAGARNLIACVK